METPTPNFRPTHRGGRLAFGLVVIVIGLLFLLHNIGIRFPFVFYRNWWALFIVCAAIWPLSDALRYYRLTSRIDGRVIHSLLSASVILLIAAFFLFDLSWRLWWPLFIMYGGLWIMIGNRRGYARHTCHSDRTESQES
ncbi:MAG: LiaF transmembrane domain-containing protein [Gammaproteobacteria bacterium]